MFLVWDSAPLIFLMEEFHGGTHLENYFMFSSFISNSLSMSLSTLPHPFISSSSSLPAVFSLPFSHFHKE
jgi:hypothetical protein